MWKLIFDSITNRGVAFGRDPGVGEFLIELPPSQCAWFNMHPTRYMWDGSKLVSWPGWEQEEQEAEDAQNAALAALQARIADIEATQTDAGLKQYTVAQARTWITNKIDGATTVAGVKQEVKEILLKMVPYLLK